MIPLVLSIASSSLIFVIFKLFDRFKIDTFQAIVFNYFTAFLIGIGLYRHEWNPIALEQPYWIYFAMLAAVLFISLFFIMGISSQRNGVASTSIAVKMSMAISLVFMIVGYSESVSALKLLGILLAFVGVFLVTSSDSGDKSNAKWMLIALFLGSGALDFLINVVQKHILIDLTPSIFAAIGLGLAGILGFSILLVQMIQGKSKIAGKNILAGIILGVPNYFSIYLLMLSYKSTGWTDSTVLAVTNVSVVLFSAVIGFIVFREQTTQKKIIGLLAAILAIVTLYIAN